MTSSPAPYVGPRPFRPAEHDRFFGRSHEIAQVTNLLLAERIVLLFSPSGAGKTSLIEAGVRRALETEGLAVLPRSLVSRPPGEDIAAGSNRFVASTLAHWEERLPSKRRRPAAQLARLDVTTYLAEQRKGVQETRPEVLIFDQLEEVLTADSYGDEADRARVEWFAQVGTALRADAERGRWALFAMREDYLGQLGPFFEMIPTRLAIRCRLDFLERAAAIEAIRSPIAKATAPDGGRVVFSEPAAGWIADRIRERIVRRGNEEVTVPGRYVEPVQLQVICDRLWQELRWHELPAVNGAVEIDEAYVKRHARIADALGDYYDACVKRIAKNNRAREGTIRRWFDRYLITERLTRGQVRAGAEDEHLRLSDADLSALVSAHLVRRDERHDSVWYELTHDRLIEPIQKANADWRVKHLSPLQQQAALWNSQGRKSGLLLREQALEQAEKWAKAHRNELTRVEEDFLDECRKARAAEERERSQAALTMQLLLLILQEQQRAAELQRHLTRYQEVYGDLEQQGKVQHRRKQSAKSQDTQGGHSARPWKLWPIGMTLRVRFLDGEPIVQSKVERYAKEWTRYANVTFDFGEDPDAEIRISFSSGQGSWSAIGTEALDEEAFPKSEPTMNFGWLSRDSPDDEIARVVLHEFGHALGLVLEHQNPKASIPWNKQAVYRDLSGPPNNWSREQINENMFKRFSSRDFKWYREFDRHSIMNFPIPRYWTTGNFEIGLISELSESDKKFIGELYPFEYANGRKEPEEVKS